MSEDSWGADVPISMPNPLRKDLPKMISLGVGWAMTSGGIAHDLDDPTWEEVATPGFAPLVTEPSRLNNAS